MPRILEEAKELRKIWSGFRYINARMASQFLVYGSTYYQGDIIKHADTLWKNWSGLDEVVKTWKPYHNDGGRIIIQEFYISEDRTPPAQNILFSVNMLVNTTGGRCYSPDEIRSWFLKVGLKNIEERFIDDNVIIIGYYYTLN